MTALLDWYRNHGLTTVDLRASPDGEPLYRSLGFVRTPDPQCGSHHGQHRSQTGELENRQHLRRRPSYDLDMPSFRKTALLAVLAVCAATLTAPTAANAVEAEQEGGGRLAFYNHSYGVLDDVTADAIEHSTYLHEFANFEVRTTTGGGETWTGRYLKGRETYVELFGPDDLADATEGAGGLAISPDRQGGNGKILDRLRRSGIDPIEYQQTRDFGDGIPVPWFDAIFTSSTTEAFFPWAMEYEPSYFDDPRSETEPASYPGDLSRERYLSDKYAARLMRDLTSVRFGVTAHDFDATVPLLRAGGFSIKSIPGGVIAKSDFTTIRLDRVARANAGLKQIQFRLNRPTPRHVEQIGHSTLTVGPGLYAEWNFS